MRGFPNFSEDINIFKVFPLRGTKNLRFEIAGRQSLQPRLYCDPGGASLNWTSTAFGTVNTQCNTPRSIQLGFKFDF